jgi:hypothetical protein
VSAREVTLELEANVRPFVREMTKVAVRLEGRVLSQHELEARWYVRGGFDPKYADPERRDRFAQVLAAWPGGGPVIAAAFLRGWALHRDHDVTGPPEAWHRLIGTTRLQVGGAA